LSRNKAAELEISAKTVLLTMSSSLAPPCQPHPHKSHIFILAKNQQLSNVMPMGKQQTPLLKQPNFYSACQIVNKPNPNSQQQPQQLPQW